MKYRDYKIFYPGCYYHVYNRGNNKQEIFADESDYLNFIKRCKLAAGILPPKTTRLRIRCLPKDSFSFVCYCLMPNHFHFLLRQNGDLGIDKLLSKICTSYSAYFNKKYNRVGHVFQDTFKAKIVEDDSYLKYLSAYIHNNPKNPLTYPYSSFADICGLRQGTLCSKEILLNFFDNKVNL